MDQFLATLPKPVIAILALVVGLMFFRIAQPPRTVCDAQMDIFRESQKKFLYSASSATGDGIKKAALVQEMTDVCTGDNSPGGCFELFENLKKLSVDLDNVPEQCAGTVAGEAQIGNWLWKHLRLMVLMAWGGRAPASYQQKNGWFDSSEVGLFCDLKKHAIRFYGKEQYSQWQEQMLAGVPQADQLGREQVWQRSLLSTPCDLYK